MYLHIWWMANIFWCLEHHFEWYKCLLDALHWVHSEVERQMLLLDYTLWWGLLDTRRYLLEKLLHDIRSRTKIGRLCRSNVHEAWVNYVHQSSRVHLSHANDHRNDPSPYSCLQTTKTRESLDRQPRRWLQSPKRFQLTKRTEHATTWVHASTCTGITAAVLINCCIQIN
jgi:hypothetical protein